MKKILTSLSLLALGSTAALAHHSDAGIDLDTIVTLEGTVKAFKWRQPHVYLGLEVEEAGEATDWDIQLVAVNVLARSGWTSKSLQPGDEVFIRVNPAEDGRSYGKMSSIEFTDGSPVAEKKRPRRRVNGKSDIFAWAMAIRS